MSRRYAPAAPALLLLSFVFAAAGCNRETDKSASDADHGDPGRAPPAAGAGMVKYNYLAADGGPHLVLPDALRGNWGGTSASSSIGVPSKTDDYAKACSVTGDLGLIPIPGGQALVLAGSPPMTALPKRSTDTGIDVYILKGWSGSLDDLIDHAVASTPTTDMLDTGKDWDVQGGGLTMIFAGDKPGSVAYGEYRASLPPGTYHLYRGLFKPNGADEIVICRLMRQPHPHTNPGAATEPSH